MKKIVLLLLIVLLITSCDISLNKEEESKIYLISVGITYEGFYDPLEVIPSAKNDQIGMIDQFKHLSKLSKKELISYSITQNTNNSVPQYYTLEKVNKNGTESPASTHSQSHIKDGLDKIFTEVKNNATNNDLIVFYFSGHSHENTKELDLLHDNNPIGTNPGTPLFISNTELRNYIEKIQGYRLIILDTCYSGEYVVDTDIGPGYGETAEAFDELFSFTKRGDDRIWEMTSSTKYEDTTSPISANSFSFFTKHLLGYLGYNVGLKKIGMPRENVLTLNDAYNYIYPKALQESANTPQHAQVSSSIQDLVLFSIR